MAPERPGWETSGTKKSQWDAFWLILLAFKAFGLKEGDSVASVSLQCLCTLPICDMNCSWSSPDVNATYVLIYQSLKFHPDETHRVQAPRGQNWLVVGRTNLILGDDYSVWLEIHREAGMEVSETLNFSPVTVNPSAPELDLVVVSSSGAKVRWKNLYWLFEHQSLSCEVQYKASNDAVWTWLDAGHVSQEDHELKDLEPFTFYEVQSRCISEDGEGEWSFSRTFRTLEAAPLGQVDVWRKVHLSENSEPTLHLLWKALDQEAARGVILKYTVDFWDRRKTVVGSLACLCYSVPVPAAARWAQVSAYNSAGKTRPTTLSLEQTDLPSPRDVRVLAAQSLRFNVTWMFSSSPEGVQPEQYVVEWREELSRESLDWIHLPVGSSSILLPGNFTPEEPYLVSVSAVYAQGISSSAPVRAYIQEGVPSVGPPAVQDKSVSSTVSLISWEEIPLAKRHGHLTHYTIYLKPSTSRNITTYGPVGVRERSYALKGLEPGTSYQLWMTGSTSSGEGINTTVLEFHTPGVLWQVYLAAFLSVGFLLLLAIVVVFLKREWFLSFFRKVLPFWCWERVPDPGHSLVITNLGSQGAELAQDTSLTPSAKPLEEPEILNITEPAVPQTISPARAAFSDYEKHFLPTQEELQRLT